MLERYLIPLAPFLLIGMNSVLCLFFFLCLDHEVRVMNLRWRRRQTAQESATGELKAQMAQLGLEWGMPRGAHRGSGAAHRPQIRLQPQQAQPGDPHVEARRTSGKDRRLIEFAAAREVELLLKVHSRSIYSSMEVNSRAVNS